MMAYPFYQPSYYQPQQSGIIWVSGQQEAQMFPVAPNNAVALWEQSGKVIYMKSADATGKPTLRIYDLTERKETKAPAQEYITKEELTDILGVLNGLTGEIEQMKGDLYGVAGRKRKKEVTDE